MANKICLLNNYMKSNFGNNSVSLLPMLSVDFAMMSPEGFDRCLAKVSAINEMLLSKAIFDDEQHYQEFKAVADLCLSVMLIERRLGLVKGPPDVAT